MNAKLLIAVAAFAAAASGVARADEADASQFALQFEGQRTRAEVQAEAARVPATRSIEPGKSGDEAARIRFAIERAAGNRGRAAQSLGISRATLWRRMRALGMDD